MSKTILSIFVLLSSLQVHAMIKDEGVSNTVESCGYGEMDRIYDNGCLISVYISSFPTITVEGQALDLNSPTAADRLIAEVEGTAQPILLNKIARDNKLDFETVRAIATRLPTLDTRSLVNALPRK